MIKYGNYDNNIYHYLFALSARYGHHNIIEYLTEEYPWLCSDVNRALLESASYNHIEIVETLLKINTGIILNDNKALIHSCSNGHLDVVILLLKNGFDIHLLDDCALRNSIDNKHANITKYLIENGANVDCHNGHPLWTSVQCGDLDMVKYLSDRSNTGINNALLFSIVNGHLNVVKYLIEKGGDIHDEDVLITCAKHNKTEIMKYILQFFDKEIICLILESGSYYDNSEGHYFRKILLEFLIRNNPSEYPKLIESFRSLGIDVYDMIEKEQ